ncbi:hypothetical protein [Streptomyces sp. NPDC096013]|uniref:hypothetical protein n=1 Tax=Streptomyces sp. NPDC096013 TaxID=3366069 RepID=UPI00380E5ED4
MPYDLGATARLTAPCRDAGGTLTDAGTAQLTVTLPDGSTDTPVVTNPPQQTGRYVADYVTTQAGRHLVRWVFTGPAYAFTDVLNVRLPQLPAISSLADAKNQINMTSEPDDDEIRFWLNASAFAVEYFVGPVGIREVAEVQDVTVAERLSLRQVPVLSLTALTPILDGGTSYDPDTLHVDGATGIVRRLDGGLFTGPLHALYEAGRRVVTENISAADLLIFQHLWRTQRPGRSGGLPGSSDDYSVTEPIPGLGYAIPNRAVQMLDPDRLPPGMA